MTSFLLDATAYALTTVLLAVFYAAHPAYLKEPQWLKEQVRLRATRAIKEELLSYTKKHLD